MPMLGGSSSFGESFKGLLDWALDYEDISPSKSTLFSFLSNFSLYRINSFLSLA